MGLFSCPIIILEVFHSQRSSGTWTSPGAVMTNFEGLVSYINPDIATFIGPIWCPSGADRTQVGPMLAPWTLLSGYIYLGLVLIRSVHVQFSQTMLCTDWDNLLDLSKLINQGLTMNCKWLACTQWASLTDTNATRRLVANQREIMTRLLELLYVLNIKRNIL